jgi:predicted pyridoxine 5'-phosphate oxidase superfamily flavin-nucleotide-binding protein
MPNKFILLVLAVLATSCAAKKTTVQLKEVVKTDTLVITKDRIIQKAVHDTLVINNPCDSLGILKPFKQRLVTAQGNVTIQTKGSAIEAVINLDSIQSVWEKEYKASAVSTAENKTVETIRYRLPAWAIIYMILVSLLLLLVSRFKG